MIGEFRVDLDDDDSPFFDKERNVSSPVLGLPDCRVGNLGFFLGDASDTDKLGLGVSSLTTLLADGDDERGLLIDPTLMGDPVACLFPKNPSIPC